VVRGLKAQLRVGKIVDREGKGATQRKRGLGGRKRRAETGLPSGGRSSGGRIAHPGSFETIMGGGYA